MIELLRRAAGQDPTRSAVITDEATVSYGELLESAQTAATYLSAHGIDRLAVLDHDAATVLALLGGASLVGAEVCQYPPIDDLAEIANLAERFAHDVLVTARTDIAGLPRVVRPEDLLTPSLTPVPAAPPERPLLVLTTGTTGVPRGVRHDWNRILRAAERVTPGPTERWLLAFGLHQFAGLQILVHVAAAGATLVAPAPRRPREGLAAMRKHAVSHASATPTYWRFVLTEMRTDKGAVPELTQITLGGEAVPAPLLEQLRAVFPAAHVSQVYAASEFGSSGSIRDGRSGLSTAVLTRGDDADVAMKIVGDELWVRSRIGMTGYYGEAPIDGDEWRPTGDLVDVVGDRIMFRGRTSDIINVGGVKVHPLPIEERVSSVRGVDMARVFGRPNAMTGSIVAVEVVAAAGSDSAQLKDAIRTACAELPSASRPRSITFVESIAMTGNKIVRRAP